jgi:DNA-binding transcriptional LysR family regulator
MTTERLYEFLVLSRSLNYSTAAKALYISQSVLSKHIKGMEEELGVQLLTRDTHTVTLTPAGHRFAQELAPLLAQCSLAKNRLQLQNFSDHACISIGCALEFSYASHLQIFIGNFMERYPDIDVTIDICSEGTPEALLSRYDFIFTPCEYPSQSEDLSCHLIQSHGVYVAMYPGHPLLSKSLIQIRELSGETLIIPFADELFGPYARNWQVVKKYTHDQVNCLFARNLASALFLVSLGKGIALIPRYARQLVPHNILLAGLSNSDCRFDEYLYYRKTGSNAACELFYREFRDTYLHTSSVG